jgi:hypothetical protein
VIVATRISGGTSNVTAQISSNWPSSSPLRLGHGFAARETRHWAGSRAAASVKNGPGAGIAGRGRRQRQVLEVVPRRNPFSYARTGLRIMCPSSQLRSPTNNKECRYRTTAKAGCGRRAIGPKPFNGPLRAVSAKRIASRRVIRRLSPTFVAHADECDLQVQTRRLLCKAGT